MLVNAKGYQNMHQRIQQQSLSRYSSLKGLSLRNGWPLTRLDEADSPRAIIKSMLLPDERILQVGRVSAAIYWHSVAVLILSVVFIVLLALYGLPMPLLLLAGLFLAFKVTGMFIIAFLARHYLLLVATDKRVIIRLGIINLEVIQMNYSKIESSEVASTIPGRFFGYSTVYMSGVGGHTLAVPYIVNAQEFRQSVSDVLLNRESYAADQDGGT
ncbi:MAG: PH domain-containing protein [Alphaproteobacteria bacterium]|nr:PH domain-containing protein [Alphaproteobacteria bacterium]